MTSVIYPLGKQALESAAINLSSDTIQAVLVSASYVYSASHQFATAVSGGIVSGPVQLTSITLNAPVPGVFDAADVTFVAVSGATITAIVLYKDTGSGATSPLLAYIDGISIVPNGGSITCTWDNGANRIFTL
jgi:hypothetical protein